MALIFWSKSASGQSPLESSTSTNKLVFSLYIVFLILAFIGTVFFTLKLFDSGNRVQQAIQADARARIKEAEEGAKLQTENVRAEALKEAKRIETEAGIKIAAAMRDSSLANERTSKLESDNIKLRTDLTNASSELTKRQAELEEEQQKTAFAQKEAAEAQRKVNEAIVGRLLARHIDSKLADFLKSLPPARAEIWHRDSDPEAWIFALSIREGLRSAGWTVPEDFKSVPANRFDGKDLPIWGVMIVDREYEGTFIPAIPDDPKIVAEFMNARGRKVDLRLAGLIAGLRANVKRDASIEEGAFRIFVGPRDPTQ